MAIITISRGSFSHGKERLWAAMSSKGRVGIDVAYPEEFAADYPFSRAFRPEELDSAKALCQDDTARGAALIWSAKEASVKATGTGFNRFDPLDVRVGTPLFREQGVCHDVNVYSRYQQIIESSVKRHLIGDVPVGSYLSSGIDSSSVVAFASRELKQELRTYTGYFGMSGFYDESKEAKENAKTFGCSNMRVEIGPEDFIDNFENILWHLDEPRVGMGSFSQYMVAKCASKEVKVILTGHGGDEFFAGYPVFKAIYGKQHIFKLLMNSSFRELMFAVYFTCYPFIKKEAGYFLPNIYSQKSLEKFLMPDFLYSLKQDTDVLQELNSFFGEIFNSLSTIC